MSVKKVVKGKAIIIGDRAINTIDYGLEVVADLLHASGNSSCTITSVSRDAYNQARIMYDNLERTYKAKDGVTVLSGVEYWKTKYANAGDQVIDVYVAEKKNGTDRDGTIEKMRQKAQDLFDSGIKVSRHMADPNMLQVYDIAKSTIKNKSSFLKAIKQSIAYSNVGDPRGKVNHQVIERDAYHIEIPVPASENQVTDLRSQIPTQAPYISERGTESNMVVVKYIHPSADDRRMLDQLLADKNFIGYGIGNEDAFSFEHKGKSNNERMWEALPLGNKKQFSGNEDGSYNPNVLYPIIAGTTLYFAVDKITVGERAVNKDLRSEVGLEIFSFSTEDEPEQTSEIDVKQGNSNIKTYSSNITIQNTKEPTLFPYALKRLSLDPGYVPTYNSRGIQAKDIYPQFTLKAYSKTLGLQGEDSIIDLSKDVISCSIGSRMGGGDFIIELKPKIGYLNGIVDDSATNSTSWTTKGSINVASGESVDLHNINREKLFNDSRMPKGSIGSEYRRNNMYYNNILQQSDMVWIKFENLGVEDGETLKSSHFGEWYDMIGLIDVVEVSTNSSSNDSRVTIRGRDLTKVLQDDNSYFNPYSIGHVNSLYGEDKLGNGRYLNGEFFDLSAISSRTIQQAIEFVFHRISSIGYVPDHVFDKLQDSTKVSVVTKFTQDGSSSQKEESEARGAWQCIKLFIDDSIRDLILIDDSISNPDGTILDIMNKICQDPFIEFFTDTYGDKFYMIARRPPFEAKTVREIVRQATTIDRTDGEVFGGARSGPRTNAYKAFLDERDRSRIEENKGFIDGASEELQELVVKDRRFPLIINIGSEDVLSDQLSFSNESYAWYQVTDRGNFAGATVSLGHNPSIYFDDIAQVFGNRRLEVTSNYSNYKFFESNKSEKERDLYADQAAQHLAYLVETNIHLPFTRRGTITLSGGDRRIKKGNYIYYRPTQEIYYVTGVSHSISIRGAIERTTKIDVERGMVMSYVIGVNEPVLKEDGTTEDMEVSYFDIVNIPKLEDGIRDTVTNGTADDKFDYKANISVNKDILNFFIQRRQFKQYD